jgi:hypothetical protein
MKQTVRHVSSGSNIKWREVESIPGVSTQGKCHRLYVSIYLRIKNEK